jgi:prepilin-type processing-associated H-X9-DG protein
LTPIRTVGGVLMTLDKSPLIRMLGTGASTNLFRCPADLIDKDRITYAQSSEPYFYSYEFTSYNVTGNTSPGLTTIIDNTGKAWYSKSTNVKNPSNKLMAVEPVAALMPGDEPPNEIAQSKTWVVQCGRWEPFGSNPPYSTANNFLSVRHGKQVSDACFADGHVQAVGQDYALNYIYSLPTY